MKQRRLFAMVATVASMGVAPVAAEPPAPLAAETRAQCHDVLMRALEDESPFVRVHAAEAFISLQHSAPALAAFRPKQGTKEPKYRIVVWRVLAAAEPGRKKRREYVRRIRAALLDPKGPDRTHAMEALAKLGEPAADAIERDCIRAIADGAEPASPFALWRLAQAGAKDSIARLAKLLESKDEVTRIRSIYVLGRLAPRFTAAETTLKAALSKESLDSKARPMLRAAVSEERRALLGDEKAPPGDRYFAAMFLADSGSPRDYPLLSGPLRASNADLRVSAAYALLTIDSRSKARSRPEAKK